MSLDLWLDEAVRPVSEIAQAVVFVNVPLGGGAQAPLVLFWLMAAAIFFTFYLRFVSFTHFGYAFRRLLAGESTGAGGDQSQRISSFQALATSLAAAVGLGTVGGVAVAISIGGPGATVWMIVMGLFGMASKFAECALGVKYRIRNADGSLSGGPMYYLRDGFARRGWPRTGAFLAAFFAVCCIGGAIGGGNMFQANQTFQIMEHVTGGAEGPLSGSGWIFGLGLAVLTGVVLFGGIKSIARVSEKLVPFMAIVYMLAGCAVVLVNIERLPGALMEIFNGAFGLDAAVGGLAGTIIAGLQRAAFSNEAGFGSSAIAHATARSDDHMDQGFIAMIGPFIDTVVMCTMTALVIVVSGVHKTSAGMEGVELASQAFETVMPWFSYVLAVAVFFFAYATMIGWSYFGLKSATYLFGERRWVFVGYNLVFCAAVIVGSAANLEHIIHLSDALSFAMVFPNVIGLFVLARELRRDFDGYIKTIENQGR